MLEFALVLPILLLVLLSIVGFSYLFYSWLTIYQASNEGVSFALRDPSATETAIADTTKSYMYALYEGPSNTTITVSKLPNQVAVTIQYTVPLPSIVIPLFLSGTEINLLGPIPIQATSVGFYD